MVVLCCPSVRKESVQLRVVLIRYSKSDAVKGAGCLEGKAREAGYVETVALVTLLASSPCAPQIGDMMQTWTVTVFHVSFYTQN